MTDQPRTESDRQSILDEALRSAIDTVSSVTIPVRLVDAVLSPDPNVMLPAVLQLDQMGKQLQEIIVNDPRFPGEATIILQGEGGGTYGFYPHFMGMPLVRRLLRTGDPEGTIHWLLKILGTAAADGQSITALWGVPVEQPIELTRGVNIVPMGQVPDSLHKRRITNAVVQAMHSPIMSSLNFMTPDSAIVVRRRIQPFAHRLDDGAPLPPVPLPADEPIDDIILVLTLIGPRVPLEAGHWFTFDDPDIEEAQLGGGSLTQHSIEILPTGHNSYPPLDPAKGQQTVKGYLDLKPETKDKVRVALQRLNQAMRRRNIGDRAVELVTAVECLVGDSGTTDLTYKLTVRAARLIGGDVHERRRNAAVLKKANEIRSAMVHSGRVASKKENVVGQTMSHSEIVGEAIELLGRLISKVIARGSVPDWAIFDVTEGAS